jgi:DNA helicase HerA-like ATPase
MQDFEKLGAFYLGKVFDVSANRPVEDLLLYDSKDLTTHAVCVGMTGSGKTGLCVSLIEEALIDGIPAIAIDPKGDLGNLLLLFPIFRLPTSGLGSTKRKPCEKVSLRMLLRQKQRSRGGEDSQNGGKIPNE